MKKSKKAGNEKRREEKDGKRKQDDACLYIPSVPLHRSIAPNCGVTAVELGWPTRIVQDAL